MGRSSAIDLRDAPRAEMPTGIKPMLATLVAEPFDRAGWIFEIKWDGYRAIAEVRKRQVRLYSRKHLSFADRFGPVVEALQALDHKAVLDGEIVVLDAAGKSQFQLLQRYQKTGTGHLAYCVFDLLYLDGHDLRNLALRQRKVHLQRILGNSEVIRFSEHIEEHGVAFFRAITEQGVEGMVAKNGDSTYREGVRSRQWIKVKTCWRQEAVIAGFTKGRGGRQHFGALVLGVYQGKEFTYIGHVGSGFDHEGLAELHAKLQPLAQRKCPFRIRPKTNAPVQWVRPELVCEVRFRDWSAGGHLRQPIYLGIRDDKKARSVQREAPLPPGHTHANLQKKSRLSPS